MKSLLLQPNQFHRFYRGGARIDALRGVPEGEDGRPEDWVGSTATSFGSDSEGLSRLEDGRVLRDAIAEDPEGFLGPDHVERFGATRVDAIDMRAGQFGEGAEVMHAFRFDARRRLRRRCSSAPSGCMPAWWARKT